MSSPAWGMNAGNRQLLSKELFNREKVDGFFGARNPIYRVDLWDGEMPAMYRRAKIAPSVNTVPLSFDAGGGTDGFPDRFYQKANI